MTFLQLGLSTMVLLLVSTAAAIVLLYWLKPPPRRVLVPSMLIWSRVLKERKGRSDFWRWLVSLLIALTVGLAIAMSVGRPEIGALSGTARRIAVVVDNSTTMAARSSSGRTRFEMALDRARELVRQGSSASRYLVADTTGHAPGGEYTSRRVALERIDRLQVSLGGKSAFPPRELFGDSEVFFVTDGVLVSEIPERVTVVPVFQPVANVGITAFDLRAVPANPTRFEAFLEVANHSAEARRVAAQVDGASGASLKRTFSLEPGQVRGEILDLAQFSSGPVRALIDSEEDGFELDDVAYAYLGTPRVLRVALVTTGSSYLETLLRLDPRIELEIVSPSTLSSVREPDLFVFDRFAPDTAPSVPVIAFDPTPVGWLGKHTGRELAGLSLSGTERDHPVMANVSLGDVVVERVAAVELGDFDVLVGTELEPLILAGDVPVRFVHVTFDLAQSNLPLQASFPIFLSNAVSWLTGTEVLSSPLGTISVELPGAAVTDLDGRDVPVRASPSGTSFAPDAPGLFSVRSGGGEVVVSANLLNPGISNVNASSLTEAQLEEGLESRPAESTGELWLVLIGVAFALVVVEWWTYHRRMTV
ncbi:MAG TPA: BatA domain-containing protein [Vicinamibacteria bacterium]|nr:BatA domain-containing protein [Vicinamibacteria bacterium]